MVLAAPILENLGDAWGSFWRKFCVPAYRSTGVSLEALRAEKSREEVSKKSSCRVLQGTEGGVQFYFIFAVLRALFFMQQNERCPPQSLHLCEGNPIKHRLIFPDLPARSL